MPYQSSLRLSYIVTSRRQQRARGARDGWAEQRPLARSLSVCATRRLGRGAVGGAAERHASPLEPPTAPLLDVTAAPGAGQWRARRRGRAATAGAVAAPSAPRAGSEEGLSAAQQSGTPRRSSRRQPPLRDVTAAPGAGRCAPDPRVTMMARSITVERSVPASCFGLARVSGLGMAMGKYLVSERKKERKQTTQGRDDLVSGL